MAKKSNAPRKPSAPSVAAKPPDPAPKITVLDPAREQLSGLESSFENLLAQGRLRTLPEHRDLQAASEFVRSAQICLGRARKAQLEPPTEQGPPASDSASTFLPQLSRLKANLGELILNGQVKGAESQYQVTEVINRLDWANERIRKAYKIPTDMSEWSADEYPDAFSADTTDIIELEARISAVRSQLASLSDDVLVLQDRFKRVLAKSRKQGR